MFNNDGYGFLIRNNDDGFVFFCFEGSKNDDDDGNMRSLDGCDKAHKLTGSVWTLV